MLEEIFTTALGLDNLTFSKVFLVLGGAVLCGLIAGLTYIITHRKTGYSKSFILTLVILPPVVATIIMLIGNSVAQAFSLAGAFSLIRFRSTPGEPLDIGFVFASVALGLACGIGYVAYGILLGVFLGVIIIILNSINFPEPRDTSMTLRVTIPEDLNLDGIIDDILDQYTVSYKEIRVKTVNFGSLFEITWRVELKSLLNQKELLDKIRQRNGNLNISLTRFSAAEYVKFSDLSS